MKHLNATRALKAALIGLAIVGSTAIARADIKDYEFQLSDQNVKAAPDQTITLLLVNKATGKTVPGAVIFATRLDMAPDGMQEMATRLDPVRGAEPGAYKFKATFGMEGRWQLSLSAKVQGEAGAINSKFVITALK